MKKIKSLIVLIVISLSLSGCGSGGGDSENPIAEDTNPTNNNDSNTDSGNSNNTNDDDSSSTKSVSVYFSNSLSTEESIVQPYYDWYLGKNEEQSKLNEIYENGGSIKNIIKLNAVASDKQFWIITEKNE